MIPNKCQGIIKNYIFNTENIFRSDLQVQVLAEISLKQSVANYCTTPYSVIVIGKLKVPHIACLTPNFSPGEWLLTLLNIFVSSTNRAYFYSLFKDFNNESHY